MKPTINKYKPIALGIGIIFNLLIIQNSNSEVSPGGLFIEPAITYELGDTSVNYPSPFSDSTGKVQGLGLGARIGFHINEALFLALDGRYGMPQFKDSSVNYDAKSIATNWGPTFGIQMPNMGLRIWGSYILDGELNPEHSSNIDVKLKNLSGYRVGVGFRLAAVSLNLEYQKMAYNQMVLEKLGPFSSNSSFDNVKLEDRGWIASVSFPVEF